MLNKVYQGIDVPKTMQFSISRDNFSIRARCCPRKITKNVAYVVIVLRSTYFAMLNVCWIEWWKECRSLQIPNFCVTQTISFLPWFAVQTWNFNRLIYCQRIMAQKVKSWHQLDFYWVYNPSFHWSFSVETISNEIPNFQKVE